MGFTEPDSPPPPAGVPQMPAADQGPAPVPYEGPGWALAPDMLAPLPDVSPGHTPGPGVLAGVGGANHVMEAPLAAPGLGGYEAGLVSPVVWPGDPDPGGRDIVSGSVAGSVAAAEARFGELAGDTYGLGGHVGDLMPFGPGPLDPGAGPGLTDPAGHYYDPPRAYGDEPG